MSPEPEAVARLVGDLLALSAGENVRAIEALAATLVNQCEAEGDQSAPPGCMHWLAETPSPWRGENEAAADICRRVARRALGGSLADPTGGATAFHHIDVDPDWARGRYPVAVFGSYLFYRLSAEPEGMRGSGASAAGGGDHHHERGGGVGRGRGGRAA